MSERTDGSFITHIKTNLNGVLQMTEMYDGIMMTGDDLANKIIVDLHRDHVPFLIPDTAKISAYFIRGDGYTLELSEPPYATVEDGKAVVAIPALAYAVPGNISIAVRMFLDPYTEHQRGYYDSETNDFVIVTDTSITEGPHGEMIQERDANLWGQKVVIATASCYVQMTESVSIIEPGHVIPDVNDVISKLSELDALQESMTRLENTASLAEASRVNAETSRSSAESTREVSESSRITNESSRVNAETSRVEDENARVSAENARVSAENARIAAETARQNAIQNMSIGATPLSYDATPTATISDVNGHKHIQLGLVPGKPFAIKKSFSSVSQMEAYTGSDVAVNEFVIITSTVEDPDNAKLYMKLDDGWFFITDLSGATGIQGPQGDQGVGIASIAMNADYTLTIKYTNNDEYTTPYSIRGIQGAKGDRGNGIDSVVLNDDYTITINFTDPNTSWRSPIPIRGAKGDKGDPGAGGSVFTYNSETGHLDIVFG